MLPRRNIRWVTLADIDTLSVSETYLGNALSPDISERVFCEERCRFLQKSRSFLSREFSRLSRAISSSRGLLDPLKAF